MRDILLNEHIERHISGLSFPIITLYKHPRDYPQNYVGRVFDLDKPTNLVIVADTLKELRQLVPKHMVCMNRTPTDDPCIVESYL